MKIKKLTESKLSFKQYDVNKKKLTENYSWNKEFDSELGRTVYDCGDIDGLHCYIFSEEDDGDWGYTVFIKNGRKILRHKPFNQINIDEVKAWAEKEMTEWDRAINSQPLKEELWNSSRVTDLVKYYLDRSNVPTNTLAQRIMKQMKEEGSKLPSNTTDFYDTLYRAIDDYNSQFDDDLDEVFDVDKVQKRIARVDEFDNGHVIHNDWTRMSSQEAEDKAKQMSIENPDKVYYVKYDNVMAPCSDIKWKNGEQLTEDVQLKFVDDMKEAILTVYSRHPGNFSETIENFVLSHGADLTVENVFHNVSDEAVAELYDIIRNRIIKLYGPDYDELDSEVFDLFNLSEELNEDVPMEYTDTSNFKNLQDESDEYQAELKRKSRNRQLLHKIFDKHGLMDSDDYWADKVYWMFANAQEIKVVDDASKVPHKTNDGQKIRYVISTPNAEVDVHADAFGDYIWVVTKDLLEKYTTIIEAQGKTVYKAEYYEPKIGKWVEYFSGANLEAVKRYINFPIIGKPQKRLAQYTVTGVKKPKYTFVKELDMNESFDFDMSNEFWTKEELLDFADDVCAHINETFNNSYDTQEVYLTNGVIELTVSDGETEFTTKYKPDMRKVKKPRDIERFILPVAADIIKQIKEQETITEDLSGKYSDKFRALIRKYSDSDSVIALVDDIIRYAKEDDLKDLFIDRGYDKFMSEETLEEATGKYTIMAFDNGDEFKIGVTNNIKSAFKKAKQAKDDVYQDAWVINTKTGEKVNELDEDLDVRANTNKVIELAEEGIITWQSVAEASLMYMSEYDVADMARLYNWVEDDEDEDEAPYSVRKVTNEVTELAEEGVISWESIARAALRFMSEYDVTDMASMYSWIEDEDDDLYESFNEKDFLHKLDQFQTSITVKPEDEKTVKDILRNKNISFKIDDNKEDKLKFKLNYKTLKEDINDDDLQTSLRYIDTEIPEILISLSEKLSNMYPSDIKILVKQSRAFYNLCESLVQYYNRHTTIQEDFEGEPLKGPKEGPEAGISSLLNNAIQDEFSTIQLYNDIAVTARAEGFEDIANAIDAINTDENTHVGQLQDLLKTISPNAEAIDSNQEWAEKYNEIGKLDDFVNEHLMNESISVKQLLAIAKNSSKIKLKDMKRAISNFSK